jgi:acyl dehydratase
MDQRKHFADFPAGTRLALGPFVVRREDVLAFSQEFDPQDLHLDEAVANSSVLGGLAASGWHVSGMLMRMVAENWLNGAASMGSNHVQEMKWLKPVFPGDVLTGTVAIESARVSAKRPDMGILLCRVELQNQHEVKTTEMVATVFMEVALAC